MPPPCPLSLGARHELWGLPEDIIAGPLRPSIPRSGQYITQLFILVLLTMAKTSMRGSDGRGCKAGVFVHTTAAFELGWVQCSDGRE